MAHKDGPEICIANETWISEECLKWPPKKLKDLPQRKFFNLAPASDWLEYREFNVLKRGIKSIKHANDRLNFYLLYENSLDKIKHDAEREQRRLHPVRYIETQLDYNSMFDELKEGSTSTPNVSITDNLKSGKSLCFLCGSFGGSIKCNSCQSKIFCSSCDEVYHKHPLRKDHLRQEIETTSRDPKSTQVQKQQAQSSTSTEGMNSAGYDDQYLLIPPNREKVKTATPQLKPKRLLKAKFVKKIQISEIIQDTQLADHSLEELPILVPMRKPSQMSDVASSKEPGCSNFTKNKMISTVASPTDFF